MIPKISVLMSTKSRNYGDEYTPNLLLRAINSVLNQTFADFEFIIVDDASSDGTSTILEKISAQDSRVKIFRFEESCGGLTAKRYNFAASQAQGTWIGYMFDDDEWHSELLENLIDRAKHMNIGLVYCKALVVKTKTKQKLVMGHEWNSNILRYNFVPNLCALVHRNTYALIGGSDENPKMRRYSDWEFWRRMWENNIPVTFVPLMLASVYEGKADSLGSTLEATEFSSYSKEEQIIPSMKFMERN
jgi:glycosyltransferase involved in cell wall biosynthesis